MTTIKHNGQTLTFQMKRGVLTQVTPFIGTDGNVTPRYDYVIGEPDNTVRVFASNSQIAREAYNATAAIENKRIPPMFLMRARKEQ